jgi:hypothetical protein
MLGCSTGAFGIGETYPGNNCLSFSMAGGQVIADI